MFQELTSENLVYLAAVASVRFARGRSVRELELLAAFFEVLGDNLALLALHTPRGGSAGE